MKSLTLEWIEKAEGDFLTMERESRVRKNPNPDAVCFHAQQCVEKYLKARLCEADERVPKIHDLVALLEKIIHLEPLWEAHRRGLLYLSEFSVHVRYPGDMALKEDAVAAKRYCRSFRDSARSAFVI